MLCCFPNQSSCQLDQAPYRPLCIQTYFMCAYFVTNAFYFLLQMENLGEQEENLNIVEELEIQYYEIQLELYNVQLEVLKHEEMLLIVQLDTIKRQIKGETKILFKHIFRTQK